MPQLSLYLDDETMTQLSEDARREGVSLSKRAAWAIRASHEPAWPHGYFDLYGSVHDESFDAPSEIPWENPGLSFDDFAIRSEDDSGHVLS